MLIVETPVFTKRVLETLTDDQYRELQQFIAENPEAGDQDRPVPCQQRTRELQRLRRASAEPYEISLVHESRRIAQRRPL